ncbi:hypothetical protein GCM10008949_25360 [Deinococcus humi]|nr:hypothetical protein GCM10008949_25360 [Deinococcus humi]
MRHNRRIALTKVRLLIPAPSPNPIGSGRWDGRGEADLGIQIDQQDTLASLCKLAANVTDDAGLACAARVIEYGERFHWMSADNTSKPDAHAGVGERGRIQIQVTKVWCIRAELDGMDNYTILMIVLRRYRLRRISPG